MSPLARIVADNDPRNGSIIERLLRMGERPGRRPDAEGLYHDQWSPLGPDGVDDSPRKRAA